MCELETSVYLVSSSYVVYVLFRVYVVCLSMQCRGISYLHVVSMSYVVCGGMYVVCGVYVV